MSTRELTIYKRVIHDMAEGVMTIGLDGKIISINPIAMTILELPESIEGKRFASVFFQYEENDTFNQTVLDAIYEDTVTHNTTVDYYTGRSTKKLFVSTSFLRDEEEKIGIVLLINDITELMELRDAVIAMEQIKALNKQLEIRNEFIKKTFGRYLSDDIVKNILDTKSGLEIGGKKQYVTIMFTDLRGFTAISESMEPSSLIDMLNNYLSNMIDVITGFNGTILEFIGDAIVVVFGAPVSSDTCEVDAVACGVDMQRKMEAVNRYNVSKHYPSIEMGIGIHSGEVVLGNIGSERKTKYDIIGKNVNLASRIETFSVGGQILVSETVKNRLGSSIETKGSMDIVPKGVKEPVRIYDVASVADKDGALHTVLVNEQQFTDLDRPIDIQIYVLNGKFADDLTVEAKVIALSQKEALLVCEGDDRIKVGTNIRFVCKDKDVYAKILDIRDDKVRIHMTMGMIEV